MTDEKWICVPCFLGWKHAIHNLRACAADKTPEDLKVEMLDSFEDETSKEFVQEWLEEMEPVARWLFRLNHFQYGSE